MNVNLFVFSSDSLSNVRLGYKAGLWAVSQRTPSAMQELQTKSERMGIGSLGIIYCSEIRALVMPFVVKCRADPQSTVNNVWPGTWRMPFHIIPLASPDIQFGIADAYRLLQIFQGKISPNFSHVFRIQATAAFVPTELAEEDLGVILSHIVP